MVNPDLLVEARQLWGTREDIINFHQEYRFYPPTKTPEVAEGFLYFADKIPTSSNPISRSDVYQNELKRRFHTEGERLERFSSGKRVTTDDVVKEFDIDPHDIQTLRPWLLQHRPHVLNTMLDLFNAKRVTGHRLDIPLDIPRVSDAAIHAAARDLSNYHSKLGRLFEELSAAGGFLRDVDAVPTLDRRSYFNPETTTLAIFVGEICSYAPDRTFHTRRRELIELYGHEGEGHALQHVITQKAEIPFILKESGYSTAASMEAVAQFYQRVIFEDLRQAKDVQTQLDITHVYEEIYQQQQASAAVKEYYSRLSRYAVSVLADKSLGDHNDPRVIEHRAGLIEDLALYPGYGRDKVEEHRYQYDSAGNLNPEITGELRYIVQPVERALDVVGKNGLTYGTDRSKIDLMLLTGFWTPRGLIEMASLIRK